MVTFAQGIANRLDTGTSWQLTINGGNRQDIGQVHGHLTIASEVLDPAPVPIADPVLDPTPLAQLFADIQRADSIPDNGYTLAISWGSSSEPQAVLWQDHAYE